MHTCCKNIADSMQISAIKIQQIENKDIIERNSEKNIKKGEKAQKKYLEEKKRLSPQMMQRLKRKFKTMMKNILPINVLVEMKTFFEKNTF